jgi:hypothetical protein
MKCSFGGCNSYAINHHAHGRDGSDGHLCDVCYWRSRAALTLEALEACMKIIGPPHAQESECWATTDEINAAWDKCTAAIAKAKGES